MYIYTHTYIFIRAATPGVLNVSSNSISNSNPYPPATQGAQIEFTTALPFDFQRDDWLTLVEHTYVAAISAATGMLKLSLLTCIHMYVYVYIYIYIHI